jgi:hypothetical protein
VSLSIPFHPRRLLAQSARENHQAVKQQGHVLCLSAINPVTRFDIMEALKQPIFALIYFSNAINMLH